MLAPLDASDRSRFTITARRTVTDPTERARRLAQAFAVIEGNPLALCLARAAQRGRELRETAQLAGDVPQSKPLPEPSA